MQHSNFKMEIDSGVGQLRSFRTHLVLRRVYLLASVCLVLFLLTGGYLILISPFIIQLILLPVHYDDFYEHLS